MELVPEDELETSSRGSSAPPADRIARKLDRFKRQKAAESKLLEIKERKERRGRSTKAATLSTKSHRMPTMSIEDAGLIEMNIMNDWQEQTKKAIEEATTSWYNDKPLRRKEEDE
ncbi:hypothetical protein Bca52824_021997 [Brassica carinata]|uniref:Uncharacterized protein n=1 Tax=Brassica carinata TaxID=52824 RepID=A0A8X7VG91_BRACI|nr:hypothetical protein Bca52824_021997 [Brassica carinata]